MIAVLGFHLIKLKILLDFVKTILLVSLNGKQKLRSNQRTYQIYGANWIAGDDSVVFVWLKALSEDCTHLLAATNKLIIIMVPLNIEANS